MGTIDTLTDKIKETGKKDIEKILSETQNRIESRRKDLNRKEKKWDNETLNFIEEQKVEIQRQYKMAYTMGKKRLESKERENIVSRVEELLKKRLNENIDSPDYPEILSGWIVEAAIGLNEERAIVNASEKERFLISDKLLRNIEKTIKEVAELTVTLTISEGAALSEQGITVSTEDERVSYNNKISTRLKRYRGSILEIITDELFGDKP